MVKDMGSKGRYTWLYALVEQRWNRGGIVYSSRNKWWPKLQLLEAAGEYTEPGTDFDSIL